MYYAKKLWAAGGGVVYNFVPFVAPESFNDPRKYADFGCTVNLYEKFRIYKMTWAGADIAVEFSDAIASVTFMSEKQARNAELRSMMLLISKSADAASKSRCQSKAEKTRLTPRVRFPNMKKNLRAADLCAATGAFS